MSELKAVHAFDVYEAYTKTGDDDAAQVYLKSEADRFIADLEESHKMEVEQLLIEIAELKAQKAQAEDDCAFWKNLAQKNATDNDNAVKAKQRAEAIKHYMELADKFKEKKNGRN